MHAEHYSSGLVLWSMLFTHWLIRNFFGVFFKKYSYLIFCHLNNALTHDKTQLINSIKQDCSKIFKNLPKIVMPLVKSNEWFTLSLPRSGESNSMTSYENLMTYAFKNAMYNKWPTFSSIILDSSRSFNLNTYIVKAF